MAGLTGQQIKNTYGDLLQINASGVGITSSLQTIYDGLGTATAFQLSTVGAAISNVTFLTTMSGSVTTSNFINLTGTLPTVLSAAAYAVNLQITTAGSSAQVPAALNMELLPGYTGSSMTVACRFINTVLGTGAGVFTSTMNIGLQGGCRGTGTGTNAGINSDASGGLLNFAVLGRSLTAKNSGTNIGGAFIALNTGSSPVQLAGFFGLYSSAGTPTFLSAAIQVDNGGTTSPIALFQDNGTTILTIADGGTLLGTQTWTTTTVNGTTAVQSNGTQINYNLSVYAAGTAYSLTNTATALDFGTTDPSLTLDTAGTYLLHARVNLEYNGATFAANRTVTLKLRRTNNTAADVSNSSTAIITGIVTTQTTTFVIVDLPPVIYTTALTNDAIAIFGSVNTAPSAGSLDCTEASIVAIRIY